MPTPPDNEDGASGLLEGLLAPLSDRPRRKRWGSNRTAAQREALKAAKIEGRARAKALKIARRDAEKRLAKQRRHLPSLDDLAAQVRAMIEKGE